MKIDKIIKQISEQDFNMISENFKTNKSEKFLQLFTMFRQGHEEDFIFKELGISDAAFYTLKSRLIDKIQEHLYLSISDERVDLLKNVANIDRLLYKFPKETATAMLLKMEEDLLKNDMQNELTLVYNALRKIYINSPKYVVYTQKYNRSVAFHLALDKAEVLVFEFNKVLKEYYLNRGEDEKRVLIMYKRELNYLSTLYQSHHLLVFSKIVDIQFALYVNDPLELLNDSSISSSLQTIEDIFLKYKNDKVYSYYYQMINILYFEYYISLKLLKDADSYLEKIVTSAYSPTYCNRYFFVSAFFLSVLDHYVSKDMQDKLYVDVHQFEFFLDEDDFINNLLFETLISSSFFYSAQYSKAIQCLNKTLNTYSFKHMKKVEVELKLFLAYLYVLTGKTELLDSLLRGVAKWISEHSDELDHRITNFMSIVKNFANNKHKDVKVDRLKNLLVENKTLIGENSILLRRIRIDDTQETILMANL